MQWPSSGIGAGVTGFRRFRPRLAPVGPGWVRLSVLTTVLLGGWAFLVPEGTRPHWWHWTIGGVVLVASLGSWHGQRLATTARRWTAMMWRNRRRRRGAPLPVAEAEECADPDTALQARIVIQLRPQAHMLSTPGDGRDQLPWEFVTSWLDRYGVRIDELTVCSVTATPPPSALRTAVAALVTARTPQRRDTWLTYRLSADNNVAALLARGTTVGAHGEGRAAMSPAVPCSPRSPPAGSWQSSGSVAGGPRCMTGRRHSHGLLRRRRGDAASAGRGPSIPTASAPCTQLTRSVWPRSSTSCRR